MPLQSQETPPSTRKIQQRKKGNAVIVHVRLREFIEGELFQLMVNLPKGNASDFLRTALDSAWRSGALTPSGFSFQRDEIVRSLQYQVQFAKDDLAQEREKNRLLLDEYKKLREQISDLEAQLSQNK